MASGQPWDMAWQCSIAGCPAHWTAHTEEAACETSSAINTAAIVTDGKGNFNSFSIRRLPKFG